MARIFSLPGLGPAAAPGPGRLRVGLRVAAGVRLRVAELGFKPQAASHGELTARSARPLALRVRLLLVAVPLTDSDGDRDCASGRQCQWQCRTAVPVTVPVCQPLAALLGVTRKFNLYYL